MLTERKTLLLFFLESLSLGTFLWGWIVLSGSPGRRASFLAALLSWLLFLCLSGLALYGAFFLYCRWLRPLASQNLQDSAWALARTLLPLLFLPLDLLRRFICLREIRFALLGACSLGILYLQYAYLTGLKKNGEREKKQKNKISRPLLLFIFFFTLFVYTLYSSGLVFPPQPLTGDEPHYLVITQSIVSDGDINVYNNYENEEYSLFYRGPLEAHRRAGKKGDKYQYSRHTPALSLLLVPSYCAADKLAGPQRKAFISLLRFPMSLMAALLSLFVLLAVHQLTASKKTSLLVWSLFSFSPPLIFYSHTIYPEVPAALILILIFYFVIFPQRTTLVRLSLAGAGIAFLPWLGIKYSVLTGGVFIILLLMAWKDKDRKWLNTAALAAPLVLAGLLYFAFLWTIYGSLSPFALYLGTTINPEYDVTQFFHFRITEFFRCGFGYLFDQRVGLFAYAPVYMLFFSGLYLAWKNLKREIRYAIFLFGGYWAFCALGYYWGGYCPPGRTLLPVIWVVGLLMAGPMSRRDESAVLIRRGLIALTLLITLLCLVNPWLLYHDQLGFYASTTGVQSLLLSDLSNSFLRFHRWVPALSFLPDFYWPTLAAWIIAAAAMTAAFVLPRKSLAGIPSQKTINRQLAPVLLVISLLIGYTFFDVQLENGRVSGFESYRILFQDDNTYGEEEGGFWVKGKRSALIIIAAPRKAEAITVHSSSPQQRETSIRVGSSKKRIVRKSQGKDSQIFLSPVGFPWGGEHLYTVRIWEKEGFTPFRMDRRVQDNRHLGVFIQIEVTE